MSKNYFLKTIPRSKPDFLRFIFLMVGFLLYAFGGVLLIKSSLGASPWDVFHLGLTNYTPLTIGQTGQLVGIVLIVISWYLGIKPGLGTISNMLFIGIFIDLIFYYRLVPDPAGLGERTICLLLGTVVCSIATVFCIITDFGTGPRDSLMLGLSQRLGLRIGLTRAIIELVVVILGVLLKGKIGLGTLFFAVAIGPLVEFFLPLFKKLIALPRLNGLFQQQL